LHGVPAGAKLHTMPATQDDLLKHLESLGIDVRTVTHPPVFTVAESRDLRGELPGGHTKNLFLKDKKKNFWLVSTLEHRPVDLKALATVLGSKRLSFGRDEQLQEMLGVAPGAVTPFALMNDTERNVTAVLDEAMLKESPLNFHPLRNDATTAIAPDDLKRFIESCGHTPRVLDLAAAAGDAAADSG